jgi:anti-sigma factor RsiW
MTCQWRWLRGVCRRARRLAQSFVDDETDARQTWAMQSHVRGCPQCGGEVARWRTLKAQLGALAHPVPHEQLRRLEAFVDHLGRT